MAKHNNKFKEAKPILQEPPSYLEDPVRFSLKHCETGKSTCISNVNKADLEKLYARLGYFEGMTWKQLWELERRKGLTNDKIGTKQGDTLRSAHPIFRNFFHFRVNGAGSGIFRVFASHEKNLMYILQFDPSGAIHH